MVTAYLRGNGETSGLLDPVRYWRSVLDRQPPGLVAKVTGGAGFAADAVEVFEGINTRLLTAALALVIALLVLIYRSPIFLFLPLAAVLAALERVPGVATVSGPVASGRDGVLLQATLDRDPYSTAAYDLVDDIRRAVRRADAGALVGGRERCRARRASGCLA